MPAKGKDRNPKRAERPYPQLPLRLRSTTPRESAIPAAASVRQRGIMPGDFKILATDISAQVPATAAATAYAQRELERGLTTQALERLVQLHDAQGNKTEADQWRKKLQDEKAGQKR